MNCRPDYALMPLRVPLRADEARAAPADRIAVGIESDRTTGPVTAGASHRVGLAVAVIGDVARRRGVARIAVGNGRTEKGAADNTAANPAADATGFCGRRGAQSSRG